jgi:hypothetical protein
VVLNSQFLILTSFGKAWYESQTDCYRRDRKGRRDYLKLVLRDIGVLSGKIKLNFRRKIMKMMEGLNNGRER